MRISPDSVRYGGVGGTYGQVDPTTQFVARVFSSPSEMTNDGVICSLALHFSRGLSGVSQAANRCIRSSATIIYKPGSVRPHNLELFFAHLFEARGGTGQKEGDNGPSQEARPVRCSLWYPPCPVSMRV